MTDNISIFLGLLKDRPHFHIFMLVKRQIIDGNIGDMRAKVIIKLSSMTLRFLWRLCADKESACQFRKHWVQSLGQEGPLENELATHSSILAWKISWTEEPGRLQFKGSQRVRTWLSYWAHTSIHTYTFVWGFPGGLVVKNPPVDEGDADWILGSGRSPGGGNGYPLQYSCLGNPMDRGAWWATVYGVSKSWMGLSTTQTFDYNFSFLIGNIFQHSYINFLFSPFSLSCLLILLYR